MLLYILHRRSETGRARAQVLPAGVPPTARAPNRVGALRGRPFGCDGRATGHVAGAPEEPGRQTCQHHWSSEDDPAMLFR